MRRMFPLVHKGVCLLILITSIVMASPAKTAGRSTAITPPITTAGQATQAELLCVQTPKEVVFTVNDENDSAGLTITDATDPIKNMRVDLRRDVGKTDHLGTVAGACVDIGLKIDSVPPDAHRGRFDDVGQVRWGALISAPTTAPRMGKNGMNDATRFTGYIPIGVNDHRNASYRSDESGVRPRR